MVDLAPGLARRGRRSLAVVSAPAWVWCGARRLPVPRADGFEPPAELARVALLDDAIREAVDTPLAGAAPA